MNVLWTKGKLHRIFSEESVTVHAHASGDGGAAPGRCCRLCGGKNSLRHFDDTCVWEGVEERYDQLLFDCFGVKVSPSDCMICEWCVRQLRSTERFQALVHAAFDRPFTENSSKQSIKINEPTLLLKDVKIKDPQNGTDLKMRAHTNQAFKKRDTGKKVNSVPVKYQRANIACSVCGQKYPMIVPTEEDKKGGLKFVCSRCKKNGDKTDICRRCNIVMPSNLMRDHQALHVKADLRGKSRLHQPKKLLQVKQVECVLKSQYLPKIEGKQCLRNSLYLSSNLHAIHEDSSNQICSICGKSFRNTKLLDKHLKEHPEEALYQCKNCLTAFKSKRSLQTHSLSHKTPKCFS